MRLIKVIITVSEISEDAEKPLSCRRFMVAFLGGCHPHLDEGDYTLNVIHENGEATDNIKKRTNNKDCHTTIDLVYKLIALNSCILTIYISCQLVILLGG